MALCLVHFSSESAFETGLVLVSRKCRSDTPVQGAGETEEGHHEEGLVYLVVVLDFK